MRKRLVGLLMSGVVIFGSLTGSLSTVSAATYNKADSAYCTILKRYISIEKAVDKYTKKGSKAKASDKKALDIKLTKYAITEAGIHSDEEELSRTIETVKSIADVYADGGDTVYVVKDFNGDNVQDLVVLVGNNESGTFDVKASLVYTFNGKKADYLGVLADYKEIKSDITKVISLTSKSASEVKRGNYEYNGVSSYDSIHYAD